MEAEKPKVWEWAYAALARFADERDSLVVTPTSLAVPAEVRDEFYALVYEVQRQLALEVLGEEVGRATEMAVRCSRMRSRLLDASGLAAFRLAPTLESFLSDPEAAVAKPAFGIVLDGLQGGSAVSEMEDRARREIPVFFESLVRAAYEAWAYYGIVVALEPVKFYRVFSPDTVEVAALETDEITVGTQVTSPERRIPEAVFETRDGSLFAMKSEAARELDYYGIKIQRRRDLSAGGNTAGLLAHRVLLLYRLADLENVGVVADRERLHLVPNDLLCEVLLPREMECPAYVSAFVERACAVRSRRPVQVLTRDDQGAFPEGMLEDEAVVPIERSVIGFDEAALARIAALLED
ncbi:hypothetical protein [Gordonibacter sp.]|uniref:hypothetical protein n=1 Tax=Gordonibacter sp. TaxID=1968902 RepID=UPI002FCC0712